MPVINKKWYPETRVYKDVCKSTAKADEKNDCTIIAISIVTGKPYEECRTALMNHGKRRRQGCRISIQKKALKELGFSFKTIPSKFFLNQYSELYKRCIKNITTHQPDRFPHVFCNGRIYLLFSPQHVSAMVDGKVHDWARGRRKKVTTILEIFPANSRHLKQPGYWL